MFYICCAWCSSGTKVKHGFAVWWHCFWWFCWENIQQERPGFFQKLGELTGQCCCRQAFFNLFCGQWGGPARLETKIAKNWVKFTLWGQFGRSPAALMTVKCQKEAAMCYTLPRYLNGDTVDRYLNGDTVEISWNGMLRWNFSGYAWICMDMQYRMIIFKRDLLFETMWTWTPKLFAFSTLAIQHPRHHIL